MPNDQAPVTMADWEIDKAVRAVDLRTLLSIYNAFGRCTLAEREIIGPFVDWFVGLQAQGYGDAVRQYNESLETFSDAVGTMRALEILGPPALAGGGPRHTKTREET